MGGKGSGGPRPNTGPARKVGSVRWQREQRKLRRVPATGAASASVKREPVEAPSGLPAEQRAVWLALAPHATAAGTLTAATSAAFADLCEAICLKRDMKTAIDEAGLTYLKVTIDGAGQEHQEQKAHPLLSRYVAQAVRVEAGQTRFMLTGTGKPAAVVAPPEDQFSEFDGPQLVKGAAKA